MDVPIDQAVPAGLIVNEAATNAVKHAFPGGRSGTIRVEFVCNRAARQGALVVADNGVGMGAPRPGGSGLELMAALAAQLGGSLERTPIATGGTAIVVTFPLRL
jgi:two-component sensor histidine kinase